jgi:hypothetical protein
MDEKANRPPDVTTTSVADEDDPVLFVLSSMTNLVSRDTADVSPFYPIFNTSPSRTIQSQQPSPRKTNNARTQSNSGTKAIETYFLPPPKTTTVPPRLPYLPSTNLSVVPNFVNNDANATSIVQPHPLYVGKNPLSRQDRIGSSGSSQLLPPYVETENSETGERAEKRRKLGSPKISAIKAPIPWAKHAHTGLESHSYESQSPYESMKMGSNRGFKDVTALDDLSSQPASPTIHRSPSLEIPRKATTPPLAITAETPPPTSAQNPIEIDEEMDLNSILPSPPCSSNLNSVHETILRNRMEFEEDHFGINLVDAADTLSSDDVVFLDEYDPFFDTSDVCSVLI